MALVIVFSIVSPFINLEKADAATANITPNGDVTTGWTVLGGTSDSTCAAGTHCDYVDEGSTPVTTDYASTGTAGTTGEVEEFTMSTVSNVSSATSVTIYFHLQTIVASTADTVNINLRVNGTLQTAATVNPTASWAWYSTTFNGTWNQAAVDSFQLSATRTRVGSGGNSNTWDDDVRLAATYATVTYTSPTPTLEQSAYRFFENQDASEYAGETFAKVWNGTGWDYGMGIITDSAGNYVVTGYTDSYGAGDQDMFIAKFNSSGVEQWRKTWSGTLSDVGNAIITDSAGNYIVTGATASYGTNSNYDMVITKFNSSGVEQWSKTWGGIGSEVGRAITTDSSGNYIVTGDSNYYGSGLHDMFIAKFNSSGVKQWSKTWGGTGEDYGNGITTDSSGNYIVTGSTTSYGAGSQDMYIAKFNSSGVEQWSKTWGGTGDDSGNAIITDGAGFYNVTGSTTSYGAGLADMFITQFNSSGVEQWSKTWGNTSGESGIDIVADNANNYIVTGQTTSYGAGNIDMVITKFNSSGVEQWSKTWGGTDWDTGYAITIDNANNYIVTGQTRSYGPGNADMFITKHSPGGDITNCSSCQTQTVTEANQAITEADQVITEANQTVTEADQTITEADQTPAITDICPETTFAKAWGGAGTDTANAITLDSSGNSYVVGRTDSTGLTSGDNDQTLVKRNSSGVEQWSKTWGGTGFELALSVALDSAGNIYVAGYTNSTGFTSGGNDQTLVKYNSSGVEQWSKTWGGAGGDVGYAVALDSAGNIYVAGYTDSTGLTSGLIDQTLVKYNTSGVEQWSKTWGGDGNDYGYALALDTSGNIYVAGETNSTGLTSTGIDQTLVKYNSSGVEQWSKSWGGNATDRSYALALDTSGNIYVAGESQSTNLSNTSVDQTLVKYNSSGVEQWSKSWGGNATDRSYGLALDSAGNIYVAGITDSAGLTSGGNDQTLVKYNSSGVEQWSKTWGGTGGDTTMALAIDSAGNIYVPGTTASFTSGGNDQSLLKFDSTGTIANCSSCVDRTTAEVDRTTAEVDRTTAEVDRATAEVDRATAEVDRTGVATITDICPETTFAKTWGGTGSDRADDVIVDSAGNYIVTGYTSSYGTGGEMLITKFNSSGIEQWSKTLGGTGSDQGRAIYIDSSNNIIVAGTTNGFGAAGVTDLIISKFDASGVEQWTKRWGGTLYDQIYDIITDSTDNIIVTGFIQNSGTSNNDLIITKFNTSGIEQWTKTLSSPWGVQGESITTDSSGNFIITGLMSGIGAGNSDMFITKFNTSGIEQWTKTWGGNFNEWGNAITKDSSGNYIVTGKTESFGDTTGDMFITKFNSSGVEQWSKTWGGAGEDEGESITTDANGNYIVMGNTTSYGAGALDMFITKFNSSGVEQWSKTWGGTTEERGYEITTDGVGNYIVTGRTDSYGYGGYDMFITKHSSSGDIANCPSCQTQTITEVDQTVTEADQTITEADLTVTEVDQTVTEADQTGIITDICSQEIKVGVGNPLAALNTKPLVTATSVFRLRLTLHVSSATFVVGAQNLKLQYAAKSGTCDTTFTGETYGDVGSSGKVQYYNNPNAIDDMPLFDNANDPNHSTDPVINQNYQESNNFTNSTDVTAGSDGLWDFALTTDNTVVAADAFCFRVVDSSGSVINTYSVIPEIEISSIQLNQSAYRWFDGTNVTYATPARVNSTTCNTATATISCTVTTPTNGNTLIAVIGTRGTTAGRVSSITQTGATWVRATEATNANGITTEIWYASNISSAGTAVSINLGAALKASAVIGQYSGLATTGALDKVANTTGSSANPNSGTTETTTNAKQLWIGGLANITSTATYSAQTNSFTEVAESASSGGSAANNNNTVLEEKIVTATGTANVSATLTSTNQWAGAIATFNAALGTPTEPTVGTVLAAQNTAATIARPDNPIRLRILLHDTLETATISSMSLKLQYAPKVGTCDTSFTGEVYQDVSSANGVDYYNNLTLTNGVAATTSADNPTHGADPVVMQSYVESAPFTNPTATVVGSDYLWDISLTPNGASGGSYCFRVVNNNNSLLTTYTQIPEFTLPNSNAERMRHGNFVSEQNGGAKNRFYW